MQDVDAFIFDLDGTLVDSSLDIANSANLLRQELGRAALPVELVVTFVGDGVGSLMQRLLGHDGPEPRPAELALARDRFRELYGPRCLEHT
ncbi:MAG: phosphoglycolate phosphatase, partial [Deltaproteobacteria bacterium CG_4_9_14_3_um_filter_63_12]